MKKLLMFASAIILMVSSVSAQKLVKAGTLVEKNTPWYFGTENASNLVLNAIKAYNNIDAKTYLSYFDDNYVKNNADRVYKEFASFKAVNRKVNIVIPVRTDGWPNQTEVQIYDDLDREYKNGSKHKQQEHRVYIVSDSSKKISMVWGSIILDDKNEYGLPNGGKFYTKTDTSTITFSNRGEVEAIEGLVKDWNKMDSKALAKYFADTVSITNNEGRKSKITSSQWANIFDDLESVEWKLTMVNPGKITNTDPVSGIIVLSSFKEKKKDGTKKHVSAFHWFMYGLDKKITSVSWMESPILPK
ncbi:MAG: hypothetical protein D4R91_05275 [Sediminibacterium sp.]|nr:MAG: hypothetical protein D4R91_05275 [Sediminibacterium sp.]